MEKDSVAFCFGRKSPKHEERGEIAVLGTPASSVAHAKMLESRQLHVIRELHRKRA